MELVSEEGDGQALSAGNEESSEIEVMERQTPVVREQLVPFTASSSFASAEPMMQGERELTTGILSKNASFRLVVRGKIGEKEIERLIRKLELDKEILSDDTQED